MGFPVLICDDSMLARKSAQRALPDDWDVEVSFAGNGKEALAMLRRHHFGLLLLDLTMPEMDGIEVLEQIKVEGIEVFVVVISGDVQPQMQQRVMALGALDFIAKPVNGSRLLTTLQGFGLYRPERHTAHG
ncbi:response regulator [Bowmanella sp. Y26]|uniref:Response regulator n=1 Tax=Bowmanella yangjiangensis TaxID=2811230 RepID=A0ABS3CMM8_9ALTE|nr:response regulator [Bowmanella yangjiangensis]MBN7818297.1 response regulator [Bowmanella yangjiangensis]MBT1062148.1 response regulator [Bowmanella yangjiangensis]